MLNIPIDGGTVRATHTVGTPGSASNVAVTIDTCGVNPIADGSDVTIVYATAEAGIASALLRTTRTAGTITVTANAGGAGSGSVSVTSQAISGNTVPLPIGATPGPTQEPGTPGPTTVPGGNLALGKTATASSSESTNPASNGNDGSTTTRWCASTGNLNEWWMVDLGAAYTITNTSIMWEMSGHVYKYKIEISTDNANWTLTADKTGNTSTAQTQTDSFAAVSARYARITVTGLDSAVYASFFEFEVYGSGAEVTPAPTTPPVTLMGDVNDDGTVNIVDALLIAQYYVGLKQTIDLAAADVNCSGTIDIIDALLVAQYYVGLIAQFPC